MKLLHGGNIGFQALCMVLANELNFWPLGIWAATFLLYSAAQLRKARK